MNHFFFTQKQKDTYQKNELRESQRENILCQKSIRNRINSIWSNTAAKLSSKNCMLRNTQKSLLFFRRKFQIHFVVRMNEKKIVLNLIFWYVNKEKQEKNQLKNCKKPIIRCLFYSFLERVSDRPIDNHLFTYIIAGRCLNENFLFVHYMPISMCWWFFWITNRS